MIDNNPLLNDLIALGNVEIEPAPILFDPPAPLPDSFDFDRIEGMLLSLAVGDALGNTSEGMNPAQRRSLHGEIRSYLPNRYAGYREVGLPSDDSQMAFWTLEQLIVDDGLIPDNLARRFCSEPIFGIGATVRRFRDDYAQRSIPWNFAGQPSAGNGALMRIAPVLVPHLRRPDGMLADAVLAGMITHNDRASNAACAAFTNMLWELLRLNSVPSAEWLVDRFTGVMVTLEGETRYTPRKPGLEYRGPVSRFTRTVLLDALAENLPVEAACSRWYSGAYLLETIPSALYILCRHIDDPEEAVVRAVNDTRDNDTIAAIVGAALGALHGRSWIPSVWLDNLLGRTGAAGDGKIYSLIAQARQSFG